MVEQAFLGYPCRHADLPVNMQRYRGEALTWWSCSMSPVHDEGAGQVVGVLCHTVETSDRVLLAKHARQSAEHLHETRELNTWVLAASNDCIKVLDLDGRLLFISECGQRVMHVSDFNALRGRSWPDFWQGQAIRRRQGPA